ncbi:recombinase family protein [Nguyenibacter vanlangensis]|uniref:Recombinase family protein n=1 Tax=Nguyenibacter vanlangensis TaxID=1216886 RepID=A0ABZ3D2X7_9PROT
MARYGYARVSTDEQTNEPQIIALRAEGVTDITMEKISGGTPARKRPVLSALLRRLRPDDSLVVAKIDRLGRDTVDVLSLIRSLHDKGINVRILNLGIETRGANGRLFLSILAAFAEFEREIIRERTKAGLVAARERGKVLGRPPALTPVQREHVRDLKAQGMSATRIAGILDVSRMTVWRTVQAI